MKSKIPDEKGSGSRKEQDMPVDRACKRNGAAKRRVVFQVRAEVGSKVYLAGDFNKWDPTGKEMLDKEGKGVYTATLTLSAGDYQYKFVIDGTWCADPECVDWVQNEHGTLNSVKRIT